MASCTRSRQQQGWLSHAEPRRGRAFRAIPIFPELLPHPEAAFHAAPKGAVHVIQRYRDSAVNLRTSLLRYLARAGVDPWPRQWQNLRSSQETELAEKFLLYMVTKWLGNTEAVARMHYLQVTDDHYERAAACTTAAVEVAAADSPSGTGKVDAENDALPRRCTHLHEKPRPCEAPKQPAPKLKRIAHLRASAHEDALQRSEPQNTNQWALLGSNQ